MNHILFLMETKDLLCSRQEHIPGSLVLSQYSKPQRPFQGTAPVGGEQSFVRFRLCTPTCSHLSVISFQLFSSEYFQNLGNYQCQFPLKNKCLKNVDLFFFFLAAEPNKISSRKRQNLSISKILVTTGFFFFLWDCFISACAPEKNGKCSLRAEDSGTLYERMSLYGLCCL